MRPRLALLCLVPALAAASPDWPDVVARVRAASSAADWPALEGALRDGLVLRPGYPRLTYGLAVARLKQGAPDEALDLLGTLAASGIVMPAGTDADLAPLRGSPRWVALEARFTANLAPRAGGDLVFEFPAAPRFVPEGLARARDGTLYLGSVHERRIVRIAPDGRVHDFVPARHDGIDSVLGIALDARRGLLWANTSALPEMQGYAETDAGRAALVAFALADGRLVHRQSAPAGVRMLGDLTLGPDGCLYASAPLDGLLLRLDAPDGRLTPLTTPGALASPQGSVVTADGRALVVADYAMGLMRVALADGAVTRVSVPPDLVAYGVDGLAREGTRLVGVQNGVRPHRVLGMHLARDGRAVTRWQALAVADPRWSEPTLGVLDGRRFIYVANSQWDRFDAAHRLREDPPLAGPRILGLRVP